MATGCSRHGTQPLGLHARRGALELACLGRGRAQVLSHASYGRVDDLDVATLEALLLVDQDIITVDHVDALHGGGVADGLHELRRQGAGMLPVGRHRMWLCRQCAGG